MRQVNSNVIFDFLEIWDLLSVFSRTDFIDRDDKNQSQNDLKKKWDVERAIKKDLSNNGLRKPFYIMRGNHAQNNLKQQKS